MSPPPPTVARLVSVTRRFGKVTAVDGLDLELRQGQVLGLLGPNGSGKSTTIRMLLGLLVPTSGTVELLDGPPDLARRRRVGFLPEQRGVYEEMRAQDQLAWWGRLHGLEARDAWARAAAWLERVGLGDRKDSKLSQYSKGMQQRVQLGMALLHDPPLAVLDEPFSGLDPLSQDVFAEVIRDQTTRGTSILLCTHELTHAEQVCDRVCVIVKGHKHIDAPLATLRREAGHGAVRLRIDGDLGWLTGPEVLSVSTARGVHEVRLAPGIEPRWVLDRALAAGLTPDRFELSEPSLHEIVVRHVRGLDHEEVAFS